MCVTTICCVFSTEDIEVPEDGEPSLDNPPHYDEVLESAEKAKADTDKPKSVLKMPKAHKGIMKKTVTDKLKIQKKDSEKDCKGKKDALDVHSPKSPKHSVSMSSALSSSYNGDVTDSSMVSVQVVRSTSKSTVDHIEMVGPGELQHKRTSSLPESGMTAAAAAAVQGSSGSSSRPVIQPASHSTGIGPGSASSEDSLTTQLWLYCRQLRTEYL